MVDDLGLPLEQPLLQVERGQVADLVGLVQQRLHDPEEERAPESEKEIILKLLTWCRHLSSSSEF